VRSSQPHGLFPAMTCSGSCPWRQPSSTASRARRARSGGAFDVTEVDPLLDG